MLSVLLVGLLTAVAHCQQPTFCSAGTVIDASFSAASSCFQAFPGDDNSLDNVNFIGNCSFKGAHDATRAFEFLSSIGSGGASFARGNNDCYFDGTGYQSTLASFPACTHLSGKPNCRLGRTATGAAVDYNAYIGSVLCSLAQHGDLHPVDTSMCFKTMQRMVCSLFDPSMVQSGGFADFRLHLSPQAYVTVQQYRWCQESACDMLSEQCANSPYFAPMTQFACTAPIMQPGCKSNADCGGFNAGKDCVASTLDSTRSACLLACDAATSCPGGRCILPGGGEPPVPATAGDDDDDDDKGGKSANVVLIVMMTFLGACTLYCCLGIMYKRFVHKATGRDQIPNVELWAGLGRCCSNMCSRCRCRRGGMGYSAAPPPYDW